MNLDASLRTLWTSINDTWRIDVPAGWMQGRSAFGGLTAALMIIAGKLKRRHQTGCAKFGNSF